MIPSIRRYFFVIFAAFFIIVSPIIAIFSLGYDINLENQTLENKLSISIDTIPVRVQVTSGDTQLRGHNTFKSKVDTLIPLSIQRDGYFQENFVLWSEPNTNAFATIRNLTLWPTEPNIFETEDTIITILSKNRILLQNQDGEFYIQIYDVRGFREVKIKVEYESRNQLDLSTGWKEVGANTFWHAESNLVLQEARQNQWKMSDLSRYIDEPAAIAPINNDRLLVLSKDGTLWAWDRSTTQKEFIESYIEGLYLMDNPATVWILNNNILYRFNSNTFSTNLDSIVFDNFEHSTADDIITKTSVLEHDSFSVEPLYQGFAIRAGATLYYSYDFNVNDWIVLTRNARATTVYGHTLFWIKEDGTIWTYNLQLDTITRLGVLNFEDDDKVSIFYNFTQQRLMIYPPNGLYTSWIGIDETNSAITEYPLYKITDMKCYPKMERSQFCFTNNTLQSFQNTRLF